VTTASEVVLKSPPAWKDKSLDLSLAHTFTQFSLAGYHAFTSSFSAFAVHTTSDRKLCGGLGPRLLIQYSQNLPG